MKKTVLLLLLLTLLGFALTGEGKNEATPAAGESGSLTLFAAASTTDLVEEIGALFTQETGIEVKINPASSGTLAKQIEQGAPADVYISASQKWMTYVNGLDAASESQPLVKNRLVLIAPLGAEESLEEIDGSLPFPESFEGRLSLGDPAHVPAGKYGVEALSYFNWNEELENRFLPGTDVRSAMAVVEREEAERGIVYETDAAKSEKVVIIGRFPEESHTPIQYYTALLKQSSPGGEKFYRFLLESSEVKELYLKYGFTPAGE
ncbi:MAG: molybdate ABC transporter substrate-binding protein [Spirochaetales bacterium]|nr:molybdate ABC transporter substrate-binding protein [Spirochaetales bacterium]